MNKTLKLQILITLIVAILTLTSCNFLDIKSNRSNDNYEKEIIKDKILKSTNISNKKQIKDLVKIGKDYYFVHEAKDLIKKLYKYEEDKEVKLLFEHSNMKLYPSDEYLYVHYYESLGYRNKVLYIEDEEINDCDGLNNGILKFSKNNKSVASIEGPFTYTVYKGKKSYVKIGCMSIDFGENPNTGEITDIKNYAEFSSDGEIFYVIYSLNWGKDVFYKFNLIEENDWLGNLDVYSFQKYGFYDDKNYKFNPDTGDVMYLSDWIDSKGKQVKNEYKYLYLRNIYTGNMYVVSRINANRLDKYTYEFTEDNKIKINDAVIKRDIKIKKNLVYSENNSKK